jgi:hypothetical protein
MNVDELYGLTNWIKTNVVNTQISNKYQGLFNVIHTNTQPNQQKRPFENEKNALINALEAININELTKEQIVYIDQMKITPHIGHTAVEKSNDILFRNQLDLAACAQKIQEIINDNNNGLQISNGLNQWLAHFKFEEIIEHEDKALVRIAFKNETYISTFTDFKSWSKIWYDIIYGITLVNDNNVDDVRIIGATNGSIILELLAVYGIVKIISKIILEGLKVAEKVQDMLLKSQKIKELQIKNDKAAKALEEEAEIEKKNGIESITNTILTFFKIDTTNRGDKVTALSKAISSLVDFIQKGGTVDFVAPDKNEKNDEDTNQEIAELKSAFNDIRALENKVMLLENKS